MKQKKIPLRMCVITREKLEKRELLRVVRTPDGEVLIDETSRMNGKGAYLKKTKDVINKARKNKILDRVLDIHVPDSLYDDMISIIDEEAHL